MALVQSKKNITTGFSATKTIQFTSSVTAASVLCLFVYMDKEDSPSLTGCTVADDLNGSWTVVDSIVDAANRRILASAYVKNSSAGTPTITITYTGSTNFYHFIVIAELSGRDTTAPLDGNNAQVQDTFPNSTDGITSGTFVPATDGCDIIALCGTDFDFSPSFSRGTNFGTTVESNPGAAWNMLAEFRNQASAASAAGTFTSDSASAAKIWTAAMAFKPAAGGASAVPLLMQYYN